ncbi:MAG: VCBS repeat-containing protein [Gammaproteobacteria bacterium]|nr:VCBS repeat-containing protein [Gammaproteobacteria bacterium]
MKRFPRLNDPRIPVVIILSIYVLLGITVLGFNRSPLQIALVISAACLLDWALHRVIVGQWLFPLSAVITGLSLSILVNYSHGSWLAIVPVFLAIASKYVVTYQGRHVFNPALFGIVAALLLSDDMISVSPAYQWGGTTAMAVFIVTAAVLTFGLRIRRGTLIVSFLVLYAIQLAVRAWLVRYHVPPETLFMGAVTSPAFYLFTFFMITDPMTSPPSRREQFLMAVFIVLADFVLHLNFSLATFFYAGFLYFLGRWAVLHVRRLLRERSIQTAPAMPRRRWAWIGSLAAVGWLIGQQSHSIGSAGEPMFKFNEMPVSTTGLRAKPSDVLSEVDPRLQHIAKWVLSVGDAVAVADYDGDGLQDLFLTYPLKDADDRAALYRNEGEFKFTRVALPALAGRFDNPRTAGLPSAALWFDMDNDGDSDLFISVGYGENRLLQNLLEETGNAEFVDITDAMGVNDYSISVTANVLDFDRDGLLDLMVGNSLSPYLPDYATPTRLNVFDLPPAEYPGDRRMLNFMHRTWHDANNGGENFFYRNRGAKFQKLNVVELGLDGTRWTIDIGTGDLDGDGWTDLYLANDFGPDEVFRNRSGRFERQKGRFSGEPGRDTYKGMNASFADFDNNGAVDVYVSNVHEPLQAEGSLLWMNSGEFGQDGWRALRDEATARNGLNAQRFGWGAAVGDVDRDGRMDILQANGMVDDSYDNLYDGCPDYWYWNEKIALTGPDVHGYADRWADLRGRCIFPNEANRVMINRGNYFVDIANDVGWERKSTSRGIATADFDNDGDLDVVVTHQFDTATVYRNDAVIANNWLGVALRGDGKTCNRDAIGTTVEASYRHGDRQQRQYREVVASNGFSAQNDARLLFGLADYDGPVALSVRWCGGAPQTVTLASGAYHVVEQQ